MQNATNRYVKFDRLFMWPAIYFLLFQNKKVNTLTSYKFSWLCWAKRGTDLYAPFYFQIRHCTDSLYPNTYLKWNPFPRRPAAHTTLKPLVIEILVLYTDTHQGMKGVCPSALWYAWGPGTYHQEFLSYPLKRISVVPWEAMKMSLRCRRPVLSVRSCVNHFNVDLGEAEGRYFVSLYWQV